MGEQAPTGAMAGRGAAVITGGARGLGLEIARSLSSRGYAVLLTDLDADDASNAARKLTPTAHSAALDVRDADAYCAVAERAASTPGGLQVWANNAGVLPTGYVWEHDEFTRRLVLEVNALGTINGTLAALGPMRQSGRGHVLNVVSLAGLVAIPGEAPYAASKHAALAVSLGALSDLRRAKVRDVHISSLCPDGIWTPMLYEKVDDPSAAMSSSGVLLDPQRVAEAAMGLFSDRARS